MAIASEPTSDRLRHRQVHAPVPDQFVIGTATLGNNHAAIFIWQTTERGANLFRNATVEPFDIENCRPRLQQGHKYCALDTRTEDRPRLGDLARLNCSNGTLWNSGCLFVESDWKWAVGWLVECWGVHGKMKQSGRGFCAFL